MFGGGQGGGGMPNPFAQMMFANAASGGGAAAAAGQPPGQDGPGGFIDPFQVLFGQGGGGYDQRVIEQLFAAGAFGGAEAAAQQPDPRSAGRPPTAAATLRALPKVKVTKHDIEANESDECAICLDELVVGQPALRIPCGHLYHEDCVKDWLKKSNECPVCRFELPTDDAEYERGRRKRMEGRKLRMRMTDLTVKSVQELQRLANFIDVDVRGCLEKSELVEKIAASSKVEIIGQAVDDEDSPGTGLPTLSREKLEAMTEKEMMATMEQLGVDASDCSEKARLISRLILSGRCNVVSDGQARGPDNVPVASAEPADDPMNGGGGGGGGPPLAERSVGELRKLAQRLGVSLVGCLEKGEIVARIEASPDFHG